MEDKDEANFRHALDYMSLSELKTLYHSVIVRDDECGVEVIRPDEERQTMILERTAQLIAEADYDPALGEPEPDYLSAARDFLTRD